MNESIDFPTILLVEDNADDYNATVRSFKKAHLNNPVHWCMSGKEALDYMKHEGKYANDDAIAKPGLVLLDLNMPGLDGKKTLSLMKQDQNLKKIPVVILTTSSDERDVVQCYELGASTYIQKPVNFEGLCEAVGRIKEYWFGIALLPGNSA
ncbi:MAG TPA: response regulator [Rickettsiales bacterium]|nr:response regulator [Rickettsiales bacterium]